MECVPCEDAIVFILSLGTRYLVWDQLWHLSISCFDEPDDEII